MSEYEESQRSVHSQHSQHSVHDDDMYDHRGQNNMPVRDEEDVALRRHLSHVEKGRSLSNASNEKLGKVVSRVSSEMDPRRRLMRSDSVSSGDSQGSRSSQETEEDVCFPLIPENHVRIRGIDFDELEEFVAEQSSLEKVISSSSSQKYVPQGISFGANKIEDDIAPDRFSFFQSECEDTIHGPDLASIAKGTNFKELFHEGKATWWLNCICPTDEEMRTIAKAFGLHPLTAEDIRMQETREKVELFKNYYFVCFHTFENDKESEDFLEPINVYIVVFPEGVLTFHFGPMSHSSNVRRRVRQLRDYVEVSADWICYALIDDITDSFAPIIQSIEYEADAIEDAVFLLGKVDFAVMLQRIGQSRRKVMTLMRLLSGKADVIKMFAKRCKDESMGIGLPLTSTINIANLTANVGTGSAGAAKPRGDIALYLGDIQDHVLTMYQNLVSYEKIFSRSHGNYLAQLQVQSFEANNKVTEMLGLVTVLGTVMMPLNIIPGLFGMNVRVPGFDGKNVGWFFGIVGVMILIGCSSAWFALRFIKKSAVEEEEPSSGAFSFISNFRPRGTRTVGKKEEDIRSFTSLPNSRYNRYR